MPGCSQLPHSRAGGRGAGRGHPPLLLLLFLPFPFLPTSRFIPSPSSSAFSPSARPRAAGAEGSAAEAAVGDGFRVDSGIRQAREFFGIPSPNLGAQEEFWGVGTTSRLRFCPV